MYTQNIIYTIQTDREVQTAVTTIETVINRGLYRFTILGAQTKQSSDIKDRVYAALRSSNLLNLKSDNRKIIVSISPETSVKKENFYDLGIALSCIYSIENKTPSYTILALGELSISGKVLPTKRLYQAIYTAYHANISVIACSTEDLDSIDIDTLRILSLYNIEIIADTSLAGIVTKLGLHRPKRKQDQKNAYTTHTNTTPENSSHMLHMADMSTVLRGLYISLCGGHNMIVETPTPQTFSKTYKKVYSYRENKTFGQKLHTYYTRNMYDTETYQDMTYVEKLEDISHSHAIMRRSGGMVGTYTPCACKHVDMFFEPHNQEKKCICSKRSIIQHRRYIEHEHFSLFDIKETYTEKYHELSNDTIDMLHTQIDVVRGIQRKRYIQQKSLCERDLYFYGDNSYLNKHTPLDILEKLCTSEAYDLWKTSGQDDRVLCVAMTIEDIYTMESGEIHNRTQEKKPAISKQAVLLALSYIPKMDF